MRAGKLDRLLIVERSAETLDAYGAPLVVWSVVAELRAELVESASTETVRAAGAAVETASTFRTRFVDGITPADRVIYAGRPHDVRAVKELGRRRGLEITAVARAAS